MEILRQKYDFKVQHGANVFMRINSSILSIAGTFNKEPEEIVEIINWVIETGDVYHDDNLVMYYDFGSGRLPHYQVEEK